MYYIRFTGNNGSTHRWLKIRKLEKITPTTYEAEIKLSSGKRFVIFVPERCYNLEFAEDWPSLNPISPFEVVRGVI